MILTRSQRVAQQLKEVNQTYSQKHKAANAEFMTRYAELLNAHGVKHMNTLVDFHDLPAALHEELEEHKQKLVADLAAAEAEKHSAASVIKPHLRILRANPRQ